MHSAGRCLLLLLLVPLTTVRAQGCKPPLWFSLHRPDCYIATDGSGPTPDSALANAYGKVVTIIGAPNISSITTIITDKQIKTGTLHYDTASISSNGLGSRNYSSPLFSTVEGVPSTELCGDGNYHYYLLVCTSRSRSRCTLQYPRNSAAIALSMVLPGCGQIYKKRNSRGVAFLCSFLAGVAAGGICYLASDVIYDRACAARTASVRQDYSNRRNGLLFAVGGSAALSIGVYGWNVYDAYTVSGVPIFR